MSDAFEQRAIELDAADPLRQYLDEFVPARDRALTAYLDGNSLGRPTKAAADGLAELVSNGWGSDLIRGWTDGDSPWMQWPETVGDLIGRACLGAADGQTVVADSTTVMLYKLARAAVDAAPEGRAEIVLDTDNFPTDRYVLEGISRERGFELRWIDADPDTGVTVDQVREVVGERTALVVLSHVAYRSAWLADMPAITQVVKDAGAVMLWDLCHSAGVVPMQLDEWGVDLAVGCSYKYLNGGPGAPAFGYVARHQQGRLHQPVQGWMGRAEPFEMAPGYQPAPGIRSFVSGTPPIVGMVPVRAGVEMVERAGVDAIRTKSVRLTEFAIELHDAWLAPLDVRLATPRDPERRGGHITLCRSDFRQVYRKLWADGVIPDFRSPDGIRVGLAPLTTTYADVVTSMRMIRDQIS
ncbi:kynureninase [Yimella sp. cx-51]|uniref:kynureninase n=1 Tax=Yimella sp. cx-51 TaxID=2770551 RepID=UPI00165DCEB7|nr:kynureninase [Yimella sp. cx-51]MBC9956644.1 kynureninase [Yimella sp. cx-51]QTH38885.1 kynureninase [Yimella sp. cx-51]